MLSLQVHLNVQVAAPQASICVTCTQWKMPRSWGQGINPLMLDPAFSTLLWGLLQAEAASVLHLPLKHCVALFRFSHSCTRYMQLQVSFIHTDHCCKKALVELMTL